MPGQMTDERVGLGTIVREWGRLGLIGFGGPPAHVALLRELCVERRDWIDAREFEDANAAAQLLPGPASTQLAIYCAQRVGGRRAALAGGLAFILPGLVLIIALAALTLGASPPRWARGLEAGAGAAVLAVILRVGLDLARSSLAPHAGFRLWLAVIYLLAGAAAVILFGAGVVLVLLVCGLAELSFRRLEAGDAPAMTVALPAFVLAVTTGAAALPDIAWTALKVGGLSYGGGFVIVPIMQGDAVDRFGWMTNGEFLNAVALGQITPGPVTQTVAVVGYAAAGLGGAIFAAAVAFAPSFALVILGGRRFLALRDNLDARAFLDGAGPAAVGAIFGAFVPLASGVDLAWQWALAAAAAVALLALRRPVAPVILAAVGLGAIAAIAGAPLP
jgi:chromate transporter